jgi:hypothetical protein
MALTRGAFRVLFVSSFANLAPGALLRPLKLACEEFERIGHEVSLELVECDHAIFRPDTITFSLSDTTTLPLARPAST